MRRWILSVFTLKPCCPVKAKSAFNDESIELTLFAAYLSHRVFCTPTQRLYRLVFPRAMREKGECHAYILRLCFRCVPPCADILQIFRRFRSLSFSWQTSSQAFCTIISHGSTRVSLGKRGAYRRKMRYAPRYLHKPADKRKIVQNGQTEPEGVQGYSER